MKLYAVVIGKKPKYKPYVAYALCKSDGSLAVFDKEHLAKTWIKSNVSPINDPHIVKFVEAKR
jgi:hypothetical protein